MTESKGNVFRLGDIGSLLLLNMPVDGASTINLLEPSTLHIFLHQLFDSKCMAGHFTRLSFTLS